MTTQEKNIQSINHKASSKRKLYVFLFCLLLATFFWLLNSLGNLYTTQISFKATYINSPKEKVVLNNLPETFNIKAKALGFDLLAYKMTFSKPELIIDLLKLKELNVKKDLNSYESEDYRELVRKDGLKKSRRRSNRKRQKQDLKFYMDNS